MSWKKRYIINRLKEKHNLKKKFTMSIYKFHKHEKAKENFKSTSMKIANIYVNLNKHLKNKQRIFRNGSIQWAHPQNE